MLRPDCSQSVKHWQPQCPEPNNCRMQFLKEFNVMAGNATKDWEVKGQESDTGDTFSIG